MSFRWRLKINLLVEEIDNQVQDAANVAFQEGLLPEEEMAEEQWHLKDSVMSAFNTTFQGYKTINSGFMEMSRLIDATPLHAVGQILNDIQESAARLVEYGEGEGVWKMRKKLLRRWGGAERRAGRGLRVGRVQRKKGNDDNDSNHIISKRKSTPKKRQSVDVQKDRTLHVSPGPSHDLIRDDEITKARSKEGKRKVKKVGPGGILEPVRQTSSTRARFYACPYEPCEGTVVSIEGMRSHIKQVHALYSSSCAYCPFTTKNFDSLKLHEKGCKRAYDSD